VRTPTFPADEELDAQGRRKLSGLSHHLRHWDRCVTSPTRRATQTAAALGLEATIEPLLRDCDYGRWTGRSTDEVQAQEPEALADWIKDPSGAPHGGESVVALIARVSAWLDRQLTTPRIILAVTHASVIRAAIVCALEAEPRSISTPCET
jgi:broad specificity phosphatase PhoE